MLFLIEFFSSDFLLYFDWQMAFVPPFFNNFGKSTKDLFKKKYDFEHVVKCTNKTPTGVTLEAGGFVSENRGYLKAKYVEKSFGEVEVEAHSTAAKDSKATAKLTKLATGLTTTLGVTSGKSTDGSADFEYSQQHVAVKAVARSDLDTHKLDFAASVGNNGLSVGGQVVMDVSRGANVTDANAGVEYAQRDYSVSAFTEKNMTLVNLGYFHRLSASTQLGAQLKLDTNKGSRSLTVGTEHKIDADTSFKYKTEMPSGVSAAAVEHRLRNPDVLLGVAAQFNKSSFAAEKFGVSLTFGDS